MLQIGIMTETETVRTTVAPIDEVQRGWHELTSRVGQLEAERTALESENKALRFLLERVIEHRQKSHCELVLLLTSLVSKLPLNDVGVIVSKLVEHNAQVNETSAVLAKGNADAALPEPAVLRALDETKRDLTAAMKPLVDELLSLETPIEAAMLQRLVTDPESFFSQPVIRANRCFIKGQVPRERAVREFGEEVLLFFNDMTTDPKLNPRPKPEEIVLNFKNDFEQLLQQNPSVLSEQKRKELSDLYQRIQRSRSGSDQARAQRQAFQKLSFIIDLLHYYENQSTEAPDVVFAQRLPVVLEQFVVSNPQDSLDEGLIRQAESLLAFIVNPDHRQAVVNNMGKAGGSGRTLKFILTLRAQKLPVPTDIMQQVIPEFVKHLIPNQQPPTAESLVPILRLIPQDMQRLLVRAIMDSERIRKNQAEELGKALARSLDLKGLEEQIKAELSVPPEVERQLAWDKTRQLMAQRADPGTVAASVRDRLHTKYDGEEIKQSWVVLTDADPIAFIRVFCQLPYLADGSTDPVARAVMETYVSRMMHEKYAAAYSKVLNSLRNMFRANPHSPTLLNFVALVKWIDPAAASKLSADIGMPMPA